MTSLSQSDALGFVTSHSQSDELGVVTSSQSDALRFVTSSQSDELGFVTLLSLMHWVLGIETSVSVSVVSKPLII